MSRTSTRGLEDKYLRTYYKYLQVKKWDTNYYHYPAELPVYTKEMQRFAANLKYKGKTAGFSDIVILEQKQGYGALFIELKTEKGRASLEQLAFLHNVNNNGYLGVIAYGLDAAIKITEWYMNELDTPLPIIMRKQTEKGIKFEYMEAIK